MTNEDLDHIRLFGERFGQSHAIEVVNFIVRFAVPIDASDMARFDEKRTEITQNFPLLETLQGFHIQLGSAPGPVPKFVDPKALTEFNRDGSQRWSAVFGENNQIVLQSHSYDGWSNVWPEAKRRLKLLLSCIDPYKPVRAIEHAVTDTFEAETHTNALTTSKFFVENPYIPAHLLEKDDPRWDVSHGWFAEEGQDKSDVLLRIDARGSRTNNLSIFNISNLHSLRPRVALPLQLILTEEEGSLLDQTFESFHKLNKEILCEILSPALLKRMKLQRASE